MGELMVITGPPGAGKSAVASRLVDMFDPSALVAGDAFFAFLRRGFIAPWLPEADEQNTVVIEAAAAAAGRLSVHCHVVYDGVVGPWFLSTFAHWSRCALLHYIALVPALGVCLERVRTRTGHGFADLAATRHMHTQFAAAELDQRHVLTDQGDDAQALATRIHDRITSGAQDYLTTGS